MGLKSFDGVCACFKFHMLLELVIWDEEGMFGIISGNDFGNFVGYFIDEVDGLGVFHYFVEVYGGSTCLEGIYFEHRFH